MAMTDPRSGEMPPREIDEHFEEGTLVVDDLDVAARDDAGFYEDVAEPERIERFAPRPRSRSRAPLVGGAVAAVLVAGGGLIFSLRGGGDSEPASEGDRTEEIAGAAGVDLDVDDVVDGWQELLPRLDGSRQLTDAEVAGVISGLDIPESTANQITSVSAAEIRRQLDIIEEDGDFGQSIPFVQFQRNPEGSTFYSPYVFDESGEVIFVSLADIQGPRDANGDLIEVTVDQGLALFLEDGQGRPGSIEEMLAFEASADGLTDNNLVGQGTGEAEPSSEIDAPVQETAGSGEYPAYNKVVDGVQLPEIVNDPNDAPTLLNYWSRTLELSLRSENPALIAAIYEFDDRRAEQLSDMLYAQIDEIVEAEGISRDDLRLVTLPPLEELSPPEEVLTYGGGMGFDERSSGSIRFGAAVDIHDVSDPDNGAEPRQRVWVTWLADPVEGSFENGLIASKTRIERVDSDLS